MLKTIWLLAVSSMLLMGGRTANAVEDNQPDSFRAGVITGGMKTCLKSVGSAPEEIAVPTCACAMGSMAYEHDPKSLLQFYQTDTPPDDYKKVAATCAKAMLDYRKDK